MLRLRPLYWPGNCALLEIFQENSYFLVGNINPHNGVNRIFSLDALLLFWHQLPTSLQILLWISASILLLWALIALTQMLYVRLRTRLLLATIHEFVDFNYLKSVFQKPLKRWGFLPGQGMVSLSDYFVERFDTQKELDRNFYLLLGPSGSGKTHFLLRLYAKLTRNGLSKHRAHYLALDKKPDLEQLSQLPNRSETVLLLDALDEDPLVFAHFGERMDQIIKHSRHFRKVILACSHARFAELEDLDQAYFTFVGPKESIRFNLCELVPLEGSKAIKKSVRRGLKKNHKCQTALLQEWPEIAETPLWLESLNLSPVKEGDRFYYQLFAYRVEAELQALYGKEEVVQIAHRFLEAIAGTMYLQWQEKGALQIKATELASLARAFDFDWRILKKRILILTEDEMLSFWHVSYLSFFLSRAAYRDELKPNLTRFRGLPLARTFYLEMAWLAYLKNEGDVKEYYYRSKYDHNKRSLSELNAWELPLLSRLYVNDLENKDVRFLRMLKHLKGLHLNESVDNWSDTAWLSELPAHDFTIYTNEKAGPAEIWQKKMLAGEVKIQKLVLSDALDPTLKLSPALWPKIDKGRRDILKLFNLELSDLPNEFCEESGESISSQGEKVRKYQTHLGMLELELFNQLEIHQFSDGTYNLVFRHSHRPTMLTEIIAELLEKLFEAYGEDDYHRTKLDADDLSQIEDGQWLGRCYTWQNSDFYAYPLFIYMDQAGQFQLVMCGLSSELVSEVSS